LTRLGAATDELNGYPRPRLANKDRLQDRRSFKLVWFGVVVVFPAPLVWK